MAQYVVEQVKVLFDQLEKGKGADVLATYCTPDASFHCEVLPQKTMADYSTFMNGINSTMPDFDYEILSLTSNDTNVTFVAACWGTATGPGPLPPFDPPRKMKCDYSYTFTVNEEGKVTKLYKVFDIFSAFSQLGWPLPGSQ